MKHLFLAFFFLASTLFACSQQSEIQLPNPVKTGDIALMDALSNRQSTREYTGQKMDNQTLSNLLWSAHGFNRADKRTTATSQNKQEMDVYIVNDSGVYLYDALRNILVLCKEGDMRSELGQPNITDKAAITLVYVANLDRASNREAALVDTGSITQNVYLYCASVGLGTVVRASFKRPGLHSALGLTNMQEITVVQPVGYPK